MLTGKFSPSTGKICLKTTSKRENCPSDKAPPLRRCNEDDDDDDDYDYDDDDYDRDNDDKMIMLTINVNNYNPGRIKKLK